MKALRFLSCLTLLAGGLAVAHGSSFRILNPDKYLGNVKVSMQDSIYWTYEFVNNSSEPAVFTREVVGCSCSRMFYPHDTIPAGGHGFVTVVLGTEGQSGHFEKTFCLFDQQNEFYVMTLSGEATE